MKTLLPFFAVFCFTHLASAQTQKQKAFADSCNQAISYYEDFLLKLSKGESSFNKGKKLFASSLQQLIDLQISDEVPVTDDQYNLLHRVLEDMKSKNFKTFIATEQIRKDKVKVTVKGKAITLSSDNGAPLAVVLGIIKNKLEPFSHGATTN